MISGRFWLKVRGLLDLVEWVPVSGVPFASHDGQFLATGNDFDAADRIVGASIVCPVVNFDVHGVAEELKESDWVFCSKVEVRWSDSAIIPDLDLGVIAAAFAS